MHPTSILCRAQEALHLDRASKAVLDNVRTIAEKAAKAWGSEAVLAEQRERRQDRVRVVAAELIEQKQQLRDLADLASNENPDRGLAVA